MNTPQIIERLEYLQTWSRMAISNLNKDIELLFPKIQANNSLEPDLFEKLSQIEGMEDILLPFHPNAKPLLLNKFKSSVEQRKVLQKLEKKIGKTKTYLEEIDLYRNNLLKEGYHVPDMMKTKKGKNIIRNVSRLTKIMNGLNIEEGSGLTDTETIWAQVRESVNGDGANK